MGLVHIYMARRQWADAKTLCQKFSKSAKPSFQQWGQATLQKIEAHSNGFQALSVAKPTASINSGFQPLTPSSRPRADAEGDIHDESKSDLQNLSTNLFDKPASQSANQPANQPASPPAIQPGDPKTYEWPHAGRLDQGRRLGKMKRIAPLAGPSLWDNNALCYQPLFGADSGDRKQQIPEFDAPFFTF